jgi:hypothetical protein
MNADDLKKLTTDALDRLAALLKMMARFHRYSLHNVCMISSQRPDATRVAGFQTWRTLGRFVRKGEKGIVILAPVLRRHDDAEKDSSRVVGFRAAYVFDLAQTDGEPLAETASASGEPGSRTAVLRAAIVSHGVAIEDADDLGGALGTSSGGRIQVLKGLTPPEEFVVLVHEYAHELLHRSVDRAASRDTRELEAEAVAFIVGEAIGLEVAESARDCIHLYRGDRQALFDSLDRIRDAAGRILQSLND